MRLIVVGGGLIGARHAAMVMEHPDWDLAGLVDPDPASAQGVACPRWRSIGAVDAEVDAAIIATPTSLHAEHAAECAGRGWHLLIEKPVAHSVDAARTVEAAAKTAGVSVLVGHHRRHHTRVAALKQALDGNRIGRPVTATLIWAMRKPDSYFEGNWRSAGGSPVLINLVHDLDLLRFVLGEVSSVAALPGAPLRGSGRVESGAVALAFDSGATAAISFADNAPSPWGFEAGTGENPNIGTTGQDMLWISGTEGGVAFPSLTVWRGCDWSRPATAQSPIQTETVAPLRAQLDHFLSVCRGEAAPLVDIADAARTLQLTLEIEAQLKAQPA